MWLPGSNRTCHPVSGPASIAQAMTDSARTGRHRQSTFHSPRRHRRDGRSHDRGQHRPRKPYSTAPAAQMPRAAWLIRATKFVQHLITHWTPPQCRPEPISVPVDLRRRASERRASEARGTTSVRPQPTTGVVQLHHPCIPRAECAPVGADRARGSPGAGGALAGAGPINGVRAPLA